MDSKHKLSKLWGRRHSLLRQDFPKWYKEQVSHAFWQAIAEDEPGLTRKKKNKEKNPRLWRPMRDTNINSFIPQ